MAAEAKNSQNADGYKPAAVPQALKVIEVSRAEMLPSDRKDIEKYNRNRTGSYE